MQVDIISDQASWLNAYLPPFIEQLERLGHQVRLFHSTAEIKSGDVLFILSCGQLLKAQHMALHKNNLVVHASDLPKGRGWSPLSWQILEGKNEVPLTLFECAPSVDSGVVYLQETMRFNGGELVDELRAVTASTTFDLCLAFMEGYPRILESGQVQQGEPSYYSKRTPKDSQLNPSLSLEEQFNLLRVVDNESYPAYFELNGVKYVLKIEKVTT